MDPTRHNWTRPDWPQEITKMLEEDKHRASKNSRTVLTMVKECHTLEDDACKRLDSVDEAQKFAYRFQNSEVRRAIQTLASYASEFAHAYLSAEQTIFFMRKENARLNQMIEEMQKNGIRQAEKEIAQNRDQEEDKRLEYVRSLRKTFPARDHKEHKIVIHCDHGWDD